MRQDLIVSESVVINASVSKIWKVLTDPQVIKEYLFGTETITDWQPGSSIIFQGEYKGRTYRDKGVVQEHLPNSLLSYKYWSAFSGLEDKPENYSLVTYKLREKNEHLVEFTWSQQGFANAESYEHSQKGMADFVKQIANIAERANQLQNEL